MGSISKKTHGGTTPPNIPAKHIGDMLTGVFRCLNGGENKLIQINTDNMYYIEASTLNQTTICRFPNRLIWEMNSYLSKRYKLYEYYGTRKAHNDLDIRLPTIPSQYLCFSKLDKSYISTPDYTEEELEREYKKHRNEIANYDTFCELYSMEQIDELNYIATKNIKKLRDELRIFLSGRCFVPYKKILQKAVSLSDVSIRIGDHFYMHIKAKDPKIISEILHIIQSY